MPETTTVTFTPTVRWYCGCGGCGHYGFTHYPWCSIAQFVIRMAWLCTRCNSMNAPHVDQCPCSSAFSGT